MEQAVDISKRYTLDEYIRLEETGNLRHEFFDGKLVAMPGETLLHNEICIQLLIALKSLLQSLGYKIYIESVKVKIEGEERYFYPDIVVTTGVVENSAPYKDYIIYQPLLIAEVLSDSTRKYDTVDKFIQYQKISSLKYYLLVEPEKHVVMVYEKDSDNNWLAKTYTEVSEVINLPHFNAQLSLGEIYR